MLKAGLLISFLSATMPIANWVAGPLFYSCFYAGACIIAIVGCGFLWRKKKRIQWIRIIKIAQRDKLLDQEIREKEQITLSKNRLQKEIQIRVQENLDVVMKLLNFQSNTLSDQAALQAVRKSQSRLKALALVHQHLNESSGNEYVQMSEYIQDLVRTLKNNSKFAGKVEIVTNLQEVNLRLTQAEPAGLLLHEVLTNSIKYGLPTTGNSVISIGLHNSETNRITLSVIDNGQGLAANFNINDSPTLGIRLIRGLCEQLDGKLVVMINGGLTTILTFQAEL